MKFANPCIDVAFKRIFGSEERKEITISFLNAVLECPEHAQIMDLEFRNTEQKGIILSKKDNILDVLCTDQRGKKYIIEMQVGAVKEFEKRIVFYAAKNYAMQLDATQLYQKLNPVIAVSILDFTLFPEKKAYTSIHQILDKKTYEHDLHELSFAFIELPKFTKQETELITPVDKWIYFLKHISHLNAIPAELSTGAFRQACEAANQVTWSEDERDAYDDAIIRDNDKKSMLEIAEEKGLAEGIEIGKMEGRLAEKLAIAKKMIGALDAATIAQITGLSIDEIEHLKDNQHIFARNIIDEFEL